MATKNYDAYKTALKNLNYTNFIYLFNNPNNIVATTKSTEPGNYFVSYPSRQEDGATSEYNIEANSSVASYKLDPEGFITVKDTGDFGDYPKLLPVEQYNDSVRIKEAVSNVSGNIMLNIGKGDAQDSTVDGTLDGFFRVTNDIGYSPITNHQFIKEAGRYKYNYFSEKDQGYDLYAYYINFSNSSLGGTSKSELEGVYNAAEFVDSPDTPVLFHNLLTNDNWMNSRPVGQVEQDLKLRTEGDVNFFYLQTMRFAVLEKADGTVGAFKQSLLEKVNLPDNPRWNYNMSTRIGIPYDFMEVLRSKGGGLKMLNGLSFGKGNVPNNLNDFSIKNPTPTFEEIYNYYDPQFEPSAKSLVNLNILNENALPSAYDFIYLNYQPKLLGTLVDVGLPDKLTLENTNFSNLNTYLDNLSALYEKYLRGTSYLNVGDPEIGSDGEGGSVPEFPIQPLSELPAYYYPDLSLNEKTGILNGTAKQQAINRILSNNGFRNTLKDGKNTSVPKWLEEIKKGIYFSEKSMDVFNDTAVAERVFPFAMKISIPQENMGPVAKALSEAELLDSINTHAASLIVPYDQNDVPSGDVEMKTAGTFYGALRADLDKTVEDDVTFKEFKLYQQLKLKTFKMHFIDRPAPDTNPLNDYEKVDLFLDSFSDISLQTPKNVLVYSQSEDPPAETPLMELLSKLKSGKFFEDLSEKFVDGLLRTPYDIHKGKFAHEETLMYEIVKYEIGEDSIPSYLQSIFLPITNQNNLNYLDTQVIPQKDYLYKIFVHKAIVGTKYRMGNVVIGEYNGSPSSSPRLTDSGNPAVSSNSNSAFYPSPPSTEDTDGEQYYWNQYVHEYEVFPYLQFVRVPYYNAPSVNVLTDKLNFSRIEDFPPLPPQVQILPYKGINNKLLFLFNNSIGEVREVQLGISEADKEQQKIIRETQKVLEGMPVTFRSDDIPATYEIYRIEKKPSTYYEFSKDQSAVAYTLDVFSQTSYVDNIFPNRDYYYTFRAVDIHGKVSNPSTIYKVRIIDGIDSAPYLKMESMELSDLNKEKVEDKLSFTKSFQKYLLFGLNKEQNEIKYPNVEYAETGKAIGDYLHQKVEVYANENPSGAGQVLGSPYAPKFKIRITSKQTGRKIDININLKTPKNIINDV